MEDPAGGAPQLAAALGLLGGTIGAIALLRRLARDRPPGRAGSRLGAAMGAVLRVISSASLGLGLPQARAALPPAR
jgi:hypothetical protein